MSPPAGHRNGIGHECSMGLGSQLMAWLGPLLLFILGGGMGGQHQQDGASSNACPRGHHRARIHQAHLSRC